MSSPDDPSSTDDLTALAAQAAQGNVEDFDALARRIDLQLRGWARTLTKDDDEADELAQLARIRMHQRIAQFSGRSRFSTWAYRLLQNLASDMRRSSARRANIEQQAFTVRESVDEPDRDESTRHDARFSDIIRSFRTSLTGREREIFEMVDLRGLTAVEAATRLGITASTARGLLLRARRKLRARMMDDIDSFDASGGAT